MRNSNPIDLIKSIVFYSNNDEDAAAINRLLGSARQSGLKVIQGVEQGKVQVDAALNGDIIVIQRDFCRDLDSYEQILSLAHAKKKPVVFDLDELLFELPENHADRISDFYADALMSMLQAIMEADLVTVSTPLLRDYCLPYNENVVVIPNYLNDNLWSFKELPNSTLSSEKITIGYMGEHANDPDIRMVLPALERITKKYPQQVQFQFWGIDPPAELAPFSHTDWNPPASSKYADFVSYFQTPTADIIIAPLCDNLFNSCKSPIKYLEYGAIAVPGVYSRIAPYAGIIEDGVDGFLASSDSEWEDALSKLIEDQDLRRRIADKAQQKIKQHWLLSQNAEKQMQIYMGAISNYGKVKRSFPSFYPIEKSLTRQIVDGQKHKNQQIESLSEQLNEREKAWNIQLAQSQSKRAEIQTKLNETVNSRTWKMASSFRRILNIVFPPDSRRRMMLRRLMNFLIFLLEKIIGPKLRLQKGRMEFEPSKDTVLIVSHEASLTGAPVLSLNLMQNLQKKYNVISFLLGDGSITECFRDESTFIVCSVPSRGDPITAGSLIEQLAKLYKFKFAIVNSIESRSVLPALAKRFIPAITLIHEFAAYTRPRAVFPDAVLWSQESIFSASVTHDNALLEHPELMDHPFHIIPQGRCNLPAMKSDAESQQEGERVLRELRPKNLPADTVIILGIGAVQLRKGADLFIDCAARVLRSNPSKNFRFVWIGAGYNPEADLNYSIYLADQIRRAGLQEHVFFMEATSNIEAAYETADILLISSRLDPLPNVAIDAMMHSLPVICFAKTTGIADILTANNLGEECVVPYLDIAAMAVKVNGFMESKSLREKVGEQLKQVALKEFDMPRYVKQLEDLGLAASDHIAQEQKDIAEIAKSLQPRLDFFLQPQIKNLPKDEAIRYYVRVWASGIIRRKLIPGFHPGVFFEQSKPHADGDPLANYLRAGQPDGPWQYDIITPKKISQPLSPDTRVALHIHAYYPDLLPEIMTRLNGNHVRPDLFVSVPTELVRDEVDCILKDYSGKIIDIQVTPNRGRDIGPFLTAFGKTFVKNYDVVGHLHTKKTADVQDETMSKNWRLFLLENLLGGKNNMADTILERMAADRSIGMVFPDDPYIVGWGSNKPYAETLSQRLGLSALPESFLFPIGMMFWARTESLLPIFNLGLGWQDYPTEPLPYDGSMLHALERIFPFVAAKQGFRSVLTNVAGITR